MEMGDKYQLTQMQNESFDPCKLLIREHNAVDLVSVRLRGTERGVI